MKILSVNVGLPRIVEYNGEPIATGIFKEAVDGVVKVGEVNLEATGKPTSPSTAVITRPFMYTPRNITRFGGPNIRISTCLSVCSARTSQPKA